MKKTIFIFLCVAVFTGMISGCGGTPVSEDSGLDTVSNDSVLAEPQKEAPDAPATDEEAPSEAETMKTPEDEAEEDNSEAEDPETRNPDAEVVTMEYAVSAQDGGEYAGTYTGEVDADGLPDGNGSFEGTSTDSSDGSTWTVTIEDGDSVFDNGTYDGDAKFVAEYEDGRERIYEGGYVFLDSDGFADGAGLLTWNYPSDDEQGRKQSTTQGTWTSGILSGEVTQVLEYMNGDTFTYVGGYSNERWNGAGVLTLTHAQANESGITTEIYESTWTDDVMGETVVQTICLLTGDVQVYEGAYHDNKRNGSGILTYTYADESYFVEEGTFEDDLLISGNRTNYDKDGNAIKTETVG